ncbi:hypothetical protein ABOM_009954 [Aspergillus bombycis]|uniref:Uncharacterized protein n=1 Tax=Aspergillus bombycis TaxID=109264 RepID=A0A1F7ZQD4_9EURO|nr:hypothetical protein ABOM_009954 [Aspergillus bombycis]OGM41664.1 hypothetical protein ABOM_009954 [Aspergillus bombycis]
MAIPDGRGNTYNDRQLTLQHDTFFDVIVPAGLREPFLPSNPYFPTLVSVPTLISSYSKIDTTLKESLHEVTFGDGLLRLSCLWPLDHLFSTVSTTSSTSTTNTAEPTASHTPEPSPQLSSTNTGAIAGGVVGGVAGAAILAALVWFLARRSKVENVVSPTGVPGASGMRTVDHTSKSRGTQVRNLTLHHQSMNYLTVPETDNNRCFLEYLLPLSFEIPTEALIDLACATLVPTSLFVF